MKKDTHIQILRDIDAYCHEQGIRPEVLCRLSMGDSRQYERLQKGGTMTVKCMDRFYNYIRKAEENDQA